MLETLVGLGAMVVLSMLRIPIGLSMFVVACSGLAYMRGWNTAIASAMTVLYHTGFSYTFSIIPLFILMGNLVSRAGLADELYRAAHAFIGHVRGGLAMATIIASGAFGAISGSAVATTATMAKVSMPSMRRYGYSDALAIGAVASGGTLDVLIPPSIIMVIYGIMTETHIGALFAAGWLPGAVGLICYLAAVRYMTWRDPKAGPPGERVPWRERLVTLRGIGPFIVLTLVLIGVVATGYMSIEYAGVAAAVAVTTFAIIYQGVMGVIALFTLVMGGIYTGAFTTTEAAGVGASISLLLALVRGALTWRSFLKTLEDSVSTSAMLFVIVLGAIMFGNFVNFTTMPDDLRDFVLRFSSHPIQVIIAMCVIYVLLGTAMEELSMILITIPLFFPIVVHLGFDPIWFGILIVVVVEIGLISPPVGMILFLMHSLHPEIPMTTIYRGVMPFFFATIVMLAVLIAFPEISLVLPRMIFGGR